MEYDREFHPFSSTPMNMRNIIVSAAAMPALWIAAGRDALSVFKRVNMGRNETEGVQTRHNRWFVTEACCNLRISDAFKIGIQALFTF